MAARIVLIGVLLAGWPGPAAAAQWTVRAGEQIAEVLRLAEAGDTIVVEKGHYAERLVIDKPLQLIGHDRPTLAGGNQGDTIRVTAPDVLIEGFIIRDSGPDLTEQNACIYIEPGAHRVTVRGNDIVYCLFGLWVEGVREVRVQGNLITGKRDFFSPMRGNGIQLYNTDQALIEDNNISFTRDGIYVDVSHHATFRRNRMHHLRYGTH
ncbi:MAG: right-handed parallel beta-helix repeat-containing protein, partial [Gammaproteobacteria bacterium]|nr:right-handed parallel beta-helix repeat-containing protein [Gammaproteobacteria bacterium]